jgi:hypothetical protein
MVHLRIEAKLAGVGRERTIKKIISEGLASAVAV